MGNKNYVDWGKHSEGNEGDVLIKSTEPTHLDPSSIPNYYIDVLQESGVDGFVGQDHAIKLVNPKPTDFNKSKLKVQRRTLVEGDDKLMNNNNDDKYSELKEDLRDSERRISRDITEREERFEKSMELFTVGAREREERYMKTVEEIKYIVRDGEKNRKSTTIAMWSLAITTFLGIAAMVITVAINV